MHDLILDDKQHEYETRRVKHRTGRTDDYCCCGCLMFVMLMMTAMALHGAIIEGQFRAMVLGG